jgi:hypothetical protein
VNKLAWILFWVALLAGCRKSDVSGFPFERGQLNATEVASMHSTLTLGHASGPVYRAVWNSGPVRHVCLKSGPLGGFNAFYGVAVFFPDGTLDEETTVDAPDGYEPYRLLQLYSPMVIWFRDPTGKRKDFFKEAITPEEYQRRDREAVEKLKEEVTRMEASGSDTQLVAALKARLKQIQDAREKTGKGDTPNQITGSNPGHR